jgi:hypothetical protein
MKETTDLKFGLMDDNYYSYAELYIPQSDMNNKFLLRHKGRSHLTFKMFEDIDGEPLIDEYVSIRDDYGDYVSYLHTPKKIHCTEIRDVLLKRQEEVDTFKMLNLCEKKMKKTGLYKLISAGIASKHPSLKMQSIKLIGSDQFSDFQNVAPINWRMASVVLTRP